MFREWGGLNSNVGARGVFGNVRALAKSSAAMFGVRSASSAPPIAAKPNVADLQYRGNLGGAGGESGKSRTGGKSGESGH